jgi:hypothetical protein
VVIILGLVLAVTAVVFALVPVRRLDSVAEVRVVPPVATATSSPQPRPSATPIPTPSPKAAPRLELQRQVKTWKALPDALIAAMFTAGFAVIVLGVILADVDEFSFGGAKFKLASAVASATVAQARSSGELKGDSVPRAVAEELAVRSAVDALRAGEMLDARTRPGRKRASSADEAPHGYIPPKLLEQLVDDAAKGKLGD